MNESITHYIYCLLILIMETFFDGTFVDPEKEVPIKLLKAVSEQVVMGQRITSILGNSKQAVTAIDDDEDDVTAKPGANLQVSQKNKYETSKNVSIGDPS